MANGLKTVNGVEAAVVVVAALEALSAFAVDNIYRRSVLRARNKCCPVFSTGWAKEDHGAMMPIAGSLTVAHEGARPKPVIELR